MEPALLFLVASVIGAIILIVIGKSEDARLEDLQKNGVETWGVVVKNKIRFGRVTVMIPVVRFETETGKTMELADENGEAMILPRFSAGARVLILYRRSDPTDFRILSRGRY